eukprot:3495295-Rhodomonas_salina.1
MEHLGLLEDSQGGFRPGLQMQTSILKLTYAIEEARRSKAVTLEHGSRCALRAARQHGCKLLGGPSKDSLSPSLFVFFLNLCLRHLGTAGVGVVHACGVCRNAACFTDDLALMATSIRDMNKLLAKVSEFAAWAGMELCVHKCKVASYDFGKQVELNTRLVRYNGQRLSPLSAEEAVRYLGLRLTVTGDTSA